MIKYFDSYSHFLDEADKFSHRGPEVFTFNFNSSHDWFGNRQDQLGDYPQAIKKARLGDESLVVKAEKIMDSLDLPNMGVPLSRWLPSQAGAFPNVPEYLSNNPLCMRVNGPTQDKSPIRLFVSTDSSAGISTKDIMERGVAILALSLKLQAVRPVEIVLLSENDGGGPDGSTILAIPLDNRPLCLAQARCICYTAAYFFNPVRIGQGVSWPRYYQNDFPRYYNWLCKGLNIQPQDLYIKAPYYGDPITENPKQWVMDTLLKYNALEEY
jgi:hypothetical protein